MILAFDTFYSEAKAKTVCVQFENWSDSAPSEIYEEVTEIHEEYIPGEFYIRELPCIINLIRRIPLSGCEAIIIDGFVVLNDDGKNGLGGYLYDRLYARIPVIGVAKNDFKNILNLKASIFRGKSKKPLFITTKGMTLERAAENIAKMSGEYRIPTLLKLVDSIGREKGLNQK